MITTFGKTRGLLDCLAELGSNYVKNGHVLGAMNILLRPPDPSSSRQ